MSMSPDRNKNREQSINKKGNTAEHKHHMSVSQQAFRNGKSELEVESSVVALVMQDKLNKKLHMY